MVPPPTPLTAIVSGMTSQNGTAPRTDEPCLPTPTSLFYMDTSENNHEPPVDSSTMKKAKEADKTPLFLPSSPDAEKDAINGIVEEWRELKQLEGDGESEMDLGMAMVDEGELEVQPEEDEQQAQPNIQAQQDPLSGPLAQVEAPSGSQSTAEPHNQSSCQLDAPASTQPQAQPPLSMDSSHLTSFPSSPAKGGRKLYVDLPILSVEERAAYIPMVAARVALLNSSSKRKQSQDSHPHCRHCSFSASSFQQHQQNAQAGSSGYGSGRKEERECEESGREALGQTVAGGKRQSLGSRDKGKKRADRGRQSGVRTRATGMRHDSPISIESSYDDGDDNFMADRRRKQRSHDISSSRHHQPYHDMSRSKLVSKAKDQDRGEKHSKKRWRVESEEENGAVGQDEEIVKKGEIGSDYNCQSEGEEEIDELDDELKSVNQTEDENEDIEEVEDEEVIMTVFNRHRDTCEKCGNGPADIILEKSLAKKKKSGPKKKVDEDLKSDEEFAVQLGGWLECERCVLSAHWGCLAPHQKKEVLDKYNNSRPPDSNEPKKRSVGIDEEALFLCGRCATWDRCFVCKDEWSFLAEPADKAVFIKSEPEDAGAPNTDDNAKEEEFGEKGDSNDNPVPLLDQTTKASTIEIEPNGSDTHETPTGEERTSKENGQTKQSGTEQEPIEIDDEPAPWHAPLLFRCIRCKLAYHYEHMKNPFKEGEEGELVDVARYYQGQGKRDKEAWMCHNCREWDYAVDMIIAWRPCPPDAKEQPLTETQVANYRMSLPREYLVKWKDRGFRHVTWVPHQWLLSTASMKLRRFLEKGPILDLITDETMAARGDDIAKPTIANVIDADEKSATSSRHPIGSAREEKKSEWVAQGPGPDVDAESSIPSVWSTIDRILDVMLFPPEHGTKSRPRKQRRTTRALTVSSEGTGPGTDTSTPVVKSPPPARGKDGIQPPPEEMMEIDLWEKRTGRLLTEDDSEEISALVSWCFVKWDDLQYDQSCWDTPPPVDSPLYSAYKRALKKYLKARRVKIPILTREQIRKREEEAAKEYTPPKEQPDSIVGGRLMPFQMEGFQWLLYKHFKRQSCILADDMGLGKTIQVASFLGYLGSDAFEIYPALVVVPNSTITNWVREFEKWVPHMRVVPYYGEMSSRKIIQQYELYHKGSRGNPAGLKAHVVLTTYDTITGGEFHVFKSVPRWEVLCIDEGQRLKSDSSLIFSRLKQLNSVHRLLLTGTPLNNNLRELFNLLNFLDEANFRNLEDLEARFADLNEGLVQELHEMIKPYILRRIKADVLKLPPKVEIIVPISMTPLQRGIYKSILSRNAEAINAVIKARKKRGLAGPQIMGGGIIKGSTSKKLGEGKQVNGDVSAAMTQDNGEKSDAVEPSKDNPVTSETKGERSAVVDAEAVTAIDATKKDTTAKSTSAFELIGDQSIEKPSSSREPSKSPFISNGEFDSSAKSTDKPNGIQEKTENTLNDDEMDEDVVMAEIIGDDGAE